MEIKSYKSQQVLQKATEYLNLKLAQIKGKPILFLTSGGSALKLLDGLNIDLLDKNWTISVLDERFSSNPRENNFLKLKETSFYKRAQQNGAQFLETIAGEGETRDELAERMEQQLRSWKGQNPQGEVMVTQGIGPDGHTSGIMPFPENPKLFQELFESERWIIGYDATGKNPYPDRVTTTLTFLKDQVDFSLVYAVGTDKKRALLDLVGKRNNLETQPSQILWQMKEVVLFTDQNF